MGGCGDGYLVMYRYMCESSFINAIGWSVIGFFFVLVMVCVSAAEVWRGNGRSEGKGFGLRKRECFLVLKSCFAHQLPRTIAQKFRSLRQFNFRLVEVFAPTPDVRSVRRLRHYVDNVKNKES